MYKSENRTCVFNLLISEKGCKMSSERFSHPTLMRMTQSAGPNPFLPPESERFSTDTHFWPTFKTFYMCNARSMNMHYAGFMDPTTLECLDRFKNGLAGWWYGGSMACDSPRRDRLLMQRRCAVDTTQHPWRFKEEYTVMLKKQGRFVEGRPPPQSSSQLDMREVLRAIK